MSMIELEYYSCNNSVVKLNQQEIYASHAQNNNCKIEVDIPVGENIIELQGANIQIYRIRVAGNLLDRKKQLIKDNSVYFIFDALDKHSNFSKHTGNFGTAMLRKDRIILND